MSKSTLFDVPTLVERATSTGSDGCVVCSVPTCPTCKKGEECQFTQGTCNTCAVSSCVRTDSTGGGSTNTGGIVGGAVGGVVALALIVGFLFYWFVYRKRRSVALDDSDLMLNDMKWDEESVTTTTGRGSSSDGPGEAAGPGGAAVAASPVEKPPMRRHQTYYTAQNRGAMANRRISSYESFTKPQAKRKAAGRPRGNRSAAKQQSVYLNPSHRNSVATTVSTTNASNILPIAYIPGVTVRPTKNNTRSIYSYEEESIFSDWNTIENASIVGDVVKASNAEKGPVGSGRDPTMTAIKAQPRLVPVDRIEEEDEDDMTDDDQEFEYNAAEYVPIQTATAPPTTQSAATTEPNSLGGHESDNTYSSDSDVDSDIGEINRAASLHRTQPREVLMDGHHGEIPIDISELDAPMHMQSANGSGAGSFVLDVEMDLEPYVESQHVKSQHVESQPSH